MKTHQTVRSPPPLLCDFPALTAHIQVNLHQLLYTAPVITGWAFVYLDRL